MLLSIGWRNLRRDPLRMLVAVLGVTFAVVLVVLEVGMMLGLVQNASFLIDHARADLWVSTVNVQTFDFATPISQRKQYLIESVPGVGRVEEYIVAYSVWRLPAGGNVNCQVIGFDPDGQLAPRIELVEGTLDALRNQDAVIIDEGDREKLGHVKLGDSVEILDHRAQVAGFTRGMHSFTTTPYVFTSLRRAVRYGALAVGEASARYIDRQTIYLLIQAKPGVDPQALARRIEAAVPGVEAHRQADFSARTRRYWLFEMGVGVGFLLAAFLGLLVGGAIVSQTLYTMTMERQAEFAQLKALGANMLEVARVVLEQSFVCGAAGLLLGLGICHFLGQAAEAAGTTILIPALLLAFVTVATLVLCSTASLISIARLRRLEPARVFRA